MDDATLFWSSLVTLKVKDISKIYLFHLWHYRFVGTDRKIPFCQDHQHFYYQERYSIIFSTYSKDYLDLIPQIRHVFFYPPIEKLFFSPQSFLFSIAAKNSVIQFFESISQLELTFNSALASRNELARDVKQYMTKIKRTRSGIILPGETAYCRA